MERSSMKHSTVRCSNGLRFMFERFALLYASHTLPNRNKEATNSARA